MFPEWTFRVLRLLSNENVNEQWGIANGGAASKPAWLFVQVDRAQRACGLASLDEPVCKRYLGQNGWAWYSQHLGDCDPLYREAAARKGPQCAMWYTVNFTRKKSMLLRLFILLYYKHSAWPLATTCLINSANRSEALSREKKIRFIEDEWTIC